jgi:hypothetical protein
MVKRVLGILGLLGLLVMAIGLITVISVTTRGFTVIRIDVVIRVIG